MYCGDETGSFIGDIGSHTSRFGYGGEDNPKLVVSSYVTKDGRMAGSSVSCRIAIKQLQQQQEEQLNDEIILGSILRRPFLNTSKNDGDAGQPPPWTDPNHFLRQGDIVEDWDRVETVWETSMQVLRAKDTLKHTKGGTPYSTTIGGSGRRSGGGGGGGKCVHPLLAVTPGFTQFEGYGPNYCATVHRKQYTQYTELLMERIDASSMFLAPSPMLAAFSLGRQTALVVDIGAGGCRVTPVVDGLILKHSQRRNGRGGDWLGHVTWKALLEEKIEPKPRYEVLLALKKRNSLMSLAKPRLSLFHTWAMEDLMYEIRTEPFVRLETYNEITRVPFSSSSSSVAASPGMGKDEKATSTEVTALPDAPDTPGSVTSTNSATPATYELPDGTVIDLTTALGKDLCRIPELLFSETLPFETTFSSSNSTNKMVTDTDAGTSTTASLHTLSNAPLHKLIKESLLAVGDVDIRKDLANNICLTGGASVLPNLDARLSYELSQTLPGIARARVVAPRFSVERSCASWIGASILTSLGSFQQLWLSRTEYEEYGATLAIQRFP